MSSTRPSYTGTTHNTSCTSSTSTTFSLDVTLGYGANHKTEEQLNKACSQTFNLSEMASSFFSGPSSNTSIASSAHTTSTSDGSTDISNKNQSQDRFFVASTSHVRLSVNPTELLWKTTAYLIAVFVPPHMIATCIEMHLSSSNHAASGSSFWIESPFSANFAQDILPKIHPTALSGCRVRGIILTSIAANNGPAEIIILEVPRGTSIQNDILRVTSGDIIPGDSNSSVLKILPITIVKFTHDRDDEGKTNYSGNTMEQISSMIGDISVSSNSRNSNSNSTPQIPTCPVCIHRIDPIRLGLPAPCVQQLCSKFCPSPSLIVGSWGTEEESCPKQRLLVSNNKLQLH
jgi:hypothetical protein